MEKEIIYNADLHFEHELWNKELLFWEDELKSFHNRLGELVNNWSDRELLTKLEQYQNKFIRHSEVIDTLQHDIHVHEANMAEHYKKGEDALDKVLLKKHFEMRTQMEVQRHMYGNLKKKFFKFLSDYI